MRSTSTNSTWLEVASRSPIRLTYLEEQVRRTGWTRPGALLSQRYQLQAPLAASTPTTLWQASLFLPEADAHGGAVTLQLLDPALVEDPGMLEAFFHEARAAASIDHAHVTRVLDYGVDYDLDDGVPFLVLEHLLGNTLAGHLASERRLSTPELARIFREAARGLEALHGSGLVHRRLDPAHIFLSTGAAPRTQVLFAIDELFGDNLCLVRKLSHQLSGQVRTPVKWEADVHELRARFDTAEYQSPEQLLGHDPIDARSDLWSLAVIAFEALTGTPAFSGATLGDRLVQICSGEPNLAPRDIPLPPGFAAWFHKGVHKSPDQRFRSAREMSNALAAVLGG
jgi:eukaryotic-like serine/threonine-protein kinase